MPDIRAARRRQAQQLVRAADADAALITARPNVRYLTGLASSNAALLLPADGDAVLATDFRYVGAAQRDAPDVEVMIERFLEAARGRGVPPGAARLAFEAHEMTVERHAELLAAAEGVTTRPFGRIIEALRMVEDPPGAGETAGRVRAERCRPGRGPARYQTRGLRTVRGLAP